MVRDDAGMDDPNVSRPELDWLPQRDLDDVMVAVIEYVESAHAQYAATGGMMACETVEGAREIVDRVERADRLAERFGLPKPWLADAWTVTVIEKARATLAAG